MIHQLNKILDGKLKGTLDSLSLLLLRLFFGGSMIVAHGWPKFQKFDELSSTFPDPLGIGSSFVNATLIVFAEVICAGLVAVGLLTRLSVIPLVIAMSTAFFIQHGADPYPKKELALVYLIGYVVLFLRGPGTFSFDAMIFRSSKGSSGSSKKK